MSLIPSSNTSLIPSRNSLTLSGKSLVLSGKPLEILSWEPLARRSLN